ncbi:MAG: hypothetical protein E6G08_09160 [Actinobacteria bacterium]|nr:MAG: hypothetical protein E6G08_09160 [Actinomycetota bacterium]
MRRFAAIVLVLALALAGCGGGARAQERHTIDAYFAKVNAVRDRHAAAFKSANIADQGFSAQQRPPREAARLAAAARAIAAAGDEVAAIEPPPAAARIHRELVQLYRLEAAFARELRVLDAFLRPARRELIALRRSSRTLRARVASGGRDVLARTAALHAYGVRVEGVARRLSALDPPRVLRAWQAEQVAWLHAVGPTATQLADALRVRDLVAAKTLSRRLQLQLSRPPTTTRAQRTAAIEFNRRAFEIAKLSRQIDRERARLEQKLG